MPQFTNCPLSLLFNRQAMGHRINRIHESALRLIYPNQNLIIRFQRASRKK